MSLTVSFGCEMRLFYPPVALAVRFERFGSLRYGRLDRGTTLTFIERKGGDVNECLDLRIVARFGDDRPTVTVPDDDHRPIHCVDGRSRVLHVISVGGLGGLRHGHRVAILLEDLGDRFP